MPLPAPATASISTVPDTLAGLGLMSIGGDQFGSSLGGLNLPGMRSGDSCGGYAQSAPAPSGANMGSFFNGHSGMGGGADVRLEPSPASALRFDHSFHGQQASSVTSLNSAFGVGPLGHLPSLGSGAPVSDASQPWGAAQDKIGSRSFLPAPCSIGALPGAMPSYSVPSGSSSISTMEAPSLTAQTDNGTPRSVAMSLPQPGSAAAPLPSLGASCTGLGAFPFGDGGSTCGGLCSQDQSMSLRVNAPAFSPVAQTTAASGRFRHASQNAQMPRTNMLGQGGGSSASLEHQSMYDSLGLSRSFSCEEPSMSALGNCSGTSASSAYGDSLSGGKLPGQPAPPLPPGPPPNTLGSMPALPGMLPGLDTSSTSGMAASGNRILSAGMGFGASPQAMLPTPHQPGNQGMPMGQGSGNGSGSGGGGGGVGGSRNGSGLSGQSPNYFESPHASSMLAPPASREQVAAVQGMMSKLMNSNPGKHEIRKLLQGLLSQERVAEAHCLVGMLRQVGLPVDVVMYNLLMTAYKKKRLWLSVLQVMQQMQAAGQTPDAVSFNILIDACGKAQELQRAFEYYHEMRRSGLAASVNTYTSLIDACGKCKQLARACELLDLMQREGVAPNAHTFTTIINACTQAQDLERGLQVLHRMVQCSAVSDVGHTSITPYTTLIRACGKALDVDKGFAVLQCMLDVGVKPNVVTFNCLIDACGKAQQLDKAFQAFKLMQHCNSAPDTITYTALIEACSKAGEIDRACELLGQMRSQHLQPNTATCTVLLDASTRSQRIDSSFEILSLMLNSGMRPSPAAFTALIEACNQAGRFDRAFDVLSCMKRSGVRATAATYTSLLDACTRSRALQKAMTVLQEMLNMGEPPDVNCFNMVIHICGDVGKVDFAFQILDYMMSLQLPPNSYTFADLIDTCVRAGDLRRAMQVLYEMKSAGWTPSVATQESILLACARANEPLSTLVSLLDQQRLDGRVLQPAFHVELVETLAMAGRHADAVELFSYLKIESSQASEAKVGEVLHKLQSGQRDGAETSEPLRRLIQLLKKMVGQVTPTVNHSWPSSHETVAAAMPQQYAGGSNGLTSYPSQASASSPQQASDAPRTASPTTSGPAVELNAARESGISQHDPAGQAPPHMPQPPPALASSNAKQISVSAPPGLAIPGRALTPVVPDVGPAASTGIPTLPGCESVAPVQGDATNMARISSPSPDKS